ncbi:uncharacterized protein LOC122248136 isoform X2 [Penaeus japonicus]|uniref:uncharacterized protein LOC122248136 isoform X2 n=1 Tax=Penaeus japonicus TaxID=27405 RepID=UPI001C714124|nr:uncharacterized protein LOC122248136 isoform X2 [Penaeus japonicus]
MLTNAARCACYSNPLAITVAALILMGVNIAYIYLTSLMIFSLTASKQLTREAIESVRKNTARLVAFLLVGFAEWVTSVVWFVMYGLDWDGWFVYVTLFACSFSFVWTVVVAAVAGSLTAEAKHGGLNEQMPQDGFAMVELLHDTYDRFGTRSYLTPRYEEPRLKKPIHAHYMPGTWVVPGRASPWESRI